MDIILTIFYRNLCIYKKINIQPLQILTLPCTPKPFYIPACLRFGYEDTIRVYRVSVQVIEHLPAMPDGKLLSLFPRQNQLHDLLSKLYTK